MTSAKTIYFGSAALTFCIVVVGTVFLVATCYVPVNFQTNAACAVKKYGILEDKFVLIAMVVSFAALVLNAYNVCEFFGLCSRCKQFFRRTSYQYVGLSLVFAIMAAIYDHVLISKLHSVPTTEVGNPDACLVCPHGHDKFFQAIIHIGVVIAFISVFFVFNYARNMTTAEKIDEDDNDAADKSSD